LQEFDAIVVGGGLLGAAVAYGLAKANQKVVILDGDDKDFRASRANFGLIRTQGKGAGCPEYQVITRLAADAWVEFARELHDASKIDVELELNGGLFLCANAGGGSNQLFYNAPGSLESRRSMLEALHIQSGEASPDFEILERQELAKLMPRASLGADVSGASFCRRDGHVNPLKLLLALHAGFLRHGGTLLPRHRVAAVRSSGDVHHVSTGNGEFCAPKVIVACGAESVGLARQIGVEANLVPERGQILVTERCEKVFPYPMNGLRQTVDGTVMIGATAEKVGMDGSTNVSAAVSLAKKTVRLFPQVEGLKVVRHWSGIRTKLERGHPIYGAAPNTSGAFAFICHGAVGMAPVHATLLPKWVMSGEKPPILMPFHGMRDLNATS